MQELVEWLGGAGAVERWLAVGALVAARVAPLTVLAPWLALRQAPAVLRAGVVLVLTVVVAPVAVHHAPAELPVGAFSYGLAVLREAMVGAVFAVVSALPLLALDWAGRLVDTWRGASLAEVIAPPTAERTSPIGNLYLMMGVVLFLLLGGHRLAIVAFADGLVAAPVGAPIAGADLAAVALGAGRLTADALAFAAALAAPAAAAIVLTEVALGLVARTSPQVPVFFAGMPLRAAIGLGAALLGLSVVVGGLPSAFDDAIRAAEGLVRGLAP